MRQCYPEAPAWIIAHVLDRTARQVYAKAATMGLRKTAEYLAGPHAHRVSGIDNGHRFAPGHVPANKGLRRPGWAPGRMATTQFKPGVLSGRAALLAQPVGAVRINKDGYLERKVNNDLPFQRRWRAEHLLLWESAHGPLPRGHAITFRDGNRDHIALDNFECITRRELMARNSVHRLPPELAAVVQLKGALQRQINKREGKK